MNIIMLLFLVILNGNPKTVETVDLKITITNIKAIQGNMELGIFNQSKSFLIIGKEYKSYTKKVTGNTVVFLLEGVPKDDYAISVFHDKNADKKCNLNFFGIPVEPYGFSKNFKPTIKKPAFEDCKIDAQQNMSIGIKLID